MHFIVNATHNCIAGSGMLTAENVSPNVDHTNDEELSVECGSNTDLGSLTS
jgi:hypothetical protein